MVFDLVAPLAPDLRNTCGVIRGVKQCFHGRWDLNTSLAEVKFSFSWE